MNVAAVVLLALLVFRFVLYFTGSQAAGFMTAFFLLTTPAYMWVVIEYGDYSPTDQVFLLFYFVVFLYQFERIFKIPKAPGFFRLMGNALVLWLFGMIAIHAKEPNKFIVPAVTCGVLFLNFKNNFFNCGAEKRRALMPTVIVAGLFFLPLLIIQYRSNGPLLLDRHGPLHQFFHHPTSWGTDKALSLFSISGGDLPVSVMANFGFFLGWAIIFSVIFLVIRSIKANKRTVEETNLVSPLIFLAPWFLISLSFYLVQNSDTFIRYITWALLPFAILAAILFCRVIRSIPAEKMRRWAGWVLAAMVIYTAVINFQHSFFLRRMLERLWIPKWVFFEAAYKDHWKTAEAPLFGLYRFWCRDPFAKAVFNFTLPELVSDSTVSKPEFSEVLKQYGKAYVASRSVITDAPGQITLVRQIDWNRISWQTTPRAKRKKLPPNPLYLYRIDALPVSAE